MTFFDIFPGMKALCALACGLTATAMLSAGCTGNGPSASEEPQQHDYGFVKGADISWVTQMEAEGLKFFNSAGEERECTALMKEIGMEAIRLRVWADPENGWCGKEDVLVKAQRAQALGMDIMIDFHYSGTWADPGHQTPPAAWQAFGEARLCEAVAAHTRDVLGHLKSNGIDVRWVQVGNETNDGMLHPVGKMSTGNSFIKLANAGHDAVKEIYPEAKVIIHLSNGQDGSMFSWFFDIMKGAGARYDMIGMSLYPAWWENGGWSDWKAAADACMENIRSCHSKYNKPVMLCEIGLPVNEPEMSEDAVGYILRHAKETGCCAGVFYWEPQAPDKYNGGYDKGAFRDGKPTAALAPFAL